jgi:transcription antitermination factor NusG
MFQYMLPVCVQDESIDLDPKRRTSKPIILPASVQQRFKQDLLRVEFMALTDPDLIEPYPFAKVGVKVRVLSGPYKHLDAFVEYRSPPGKRFKLIVRIPDMQMAAAVEVDEDTIIEPVAD